MKRLILSLFIALTTLIGAASCSAQKFFADVPSGNGIVKIYVGKAMLAFAGASTGKLVDGVPGDIMKSLDGVELITVENTTMIKKVRPICLEAIAKANLQQVTSIEDGDETVDIYMRPDPKSPDTAANLLVISINDGMEYVAIALTGEVDIAKVIETYASNKM